MVLPEQWSLWLSTGLVFVPVVLVLVFLFSAALRRYLAGSRRRLDEPERSTPSSENPAAFVAASVQGVIQRLREQEKELERLHRLERERLQQTERLSEAVTRNMPTGMLIVNSAGLITSANPAAEAALGVRALSFRCYSEVFGESSMLTRLVAACLHEGQTFRREEVDHATPAGIVRRLGVTISPILPTQLPMGTTSPRRPDRKTSGALILLSDLTELAALQRQMRLKESLAALGEMSAGIAHEFKNALATIQGYAQMIRSETDADEIREAATRIIQETRALSHVVLEFLRFARPLEIEPGDVELAPLVARVVSEVSEMMPGVTVAAEGEFGEVAGDEGLLRQALLNLVRNGAEAVAGQPDGRVWVRGTYLMQAGQPVQMVAVLDNGPGIADEELSKIFLPFYTTKPQGTGLGLAVVQKIILQHGGAVEARNRPEGGAEFLLTLPLRRTPAAEAVESAAARI